VNRQFDPFAAAGDNGERTADRAFETHMLC
jgi:hypothetical protein